MHRSPQPRTLAFINTVDPFVAVSDLHMVLEAILLWGADFAMGFFAHVHLGTFQ